MFVLMFLDFSTLDIMYSLPPLEDKKLALSQSPPCSTHTQTLPFLQLPYRGALVKWIFKYLHYYGWCKKNVHSWAISYTMAIATFYLPMVPVVVCLLGFLPTCQPNNNTTLRCQNWRFHWCTQIGKVNSWDFLFVWDVLLGTTGPLDPISLDGSGGLCIAVFWKFLCFPLAVNSLLPASQDPRSSSGFTRLREHDR